MTEQYCWYRTSLNYWGSVCTILTFIFKKKFYEQIEGVAMGSPVSPIVANLFMEDFERKALASAIQPQEHGIGLWMTHGSSKNRPTNRHFWIISTALIQQSTVEGNQDNGVIPFLDTLATSLADKSLSFKVYQKPTHTDQYLQ